MPQVRIGNRYVPERPLEAYEAAWVLRKTVPEVRKALSRGELAVSRAGRRRLVQAESLVGAVGCDLLKQEALAGILEGHIRAPRADEDELELSTAVANAVIAPPAVSNIAHGRSLVSANQPFERTKCR
jgi:hypothetical protein